LFLDVDILFASFDLVFPVTLLMSLSSDQIISSKLAQFRPDNASNSPSETRSSTCSPLLVGRTTPPHCSCISVMPAAANTPSHWLSEFFHLACEPAEAGCGSTFDHVLLNDGLKFSNLALSNALAIRSETCFVEYSPSSEILDLVQFPRQPEFYHEVSTNVFRAKHAHRVLKDDSDVELCACHKAIPAELLSRWQIEAQQAHLSENSAVSDAITGTLAQGKRCSARLQSVPSKNSTLSKHAASSFSIPTSNSSSDVPLALSSSSSSTSASVSSETDIPFLSATAIVPSFAYDYSQTRALEESFFSSSSAMRGACCGNGSCLNRICLVECAPQCLFAEQCQNQRFRRQQNAEVEARPTFDKGWGLFALEPVETDTFMIEYCGEVIENDECERRIQEALKEGGHRHLYHMALTDQLVIDATTHGSRARFLNHSCEPNCRIENWAVGRERRIGVFSARPIAAGEELTIDYQARFGRGHAK
jgi:hypothetical protein